MAEANGSFGGPAKGAPAAVSLDVVFTSDADAVVLSVAGELDVMTAPVLAAHIDGHFEHRAAGDTRRLVLDLSGVTFLASAGLAVLANAVTVAARYHAEVRVAAAARVVLRPLSLTGLDQALRILPDVASAVAAD